MKRALLIGILAASGLAAFWMLRGKQVLSDEEQVREVIGEMARLAGKRDVSGIMEHVSQSFHGEGGDARELKRYLAGYLLRSDWAAVVPAKVLVAAPDCDGIKASLVVLMARVPARSAAELRPEALAGAHYIEAQLVREDGEWKVAAATRRAAHPSDWLP